MIVEVPLQLWALPGSRTSSISIARSATAYRGERLIEVVGFDKVELPMTSKKAAQAGQTPAVGAQPQSIDAEMLKLTNGMKLFVLGNDKTQQARLIAVLDNLGKGAAERRCRTSTSCSACPKRRGSF